MEEESFKWSPLYGTLTVLYWLSLLTSTFFFVLRRKRQPITSRGTFLSLLSCYYGAFFFSCMAVDLSGMNHFDGPGWNCTLSNWSSVYYLPFWSIPYFLRTYLLIFKYNHHLEKISFHLASPDIRQAGWHTRHQGRIGLPVQLGVIFGAALIHTIVTLPFEFTHPTPLQGILPACSSPFLLAIAALTVIYLLVLLFFCFKVWHVKDIFSIKNELMLVVIVTFPCFFFWVLFLLLDLPEVHSQWFAMLVMFLTFLVTMVYPLYLSTRMEWVHLPAVTMEELQAIMMTVKKKRIAREADEVFNSSRVDSATSTSTSEEPQMSLLKEDSLAWYLKDQAYWNSFQYFCVQAWCVELLLFYKDASTLHALDEDLIKDEIIRMKSEYLDPDAPLELELSDEVMKETLKSLDAGQYSRHIYDSALAEVYTTLSSHVFPKWKNSSHFRQAKSSSKDDFQMPVLAQSA